MTIDIRATVTCSLGTLINGSINDDYVQGTGLIKARGSVELSGIITPAIGTAVTFSYTKGSTTRAIPRKLRVLSSFADPFRRTTKVELGCKLTYLADLREKIDWTAFDDTANAGYTAADAAIITLPISAVSVMAKCLSELGITASSSPLTNKFSVEKFDLSPGYVNVLSNLLVSECYCGYLDASEVLQVFSLNQAGGTGPVLDQSKIIDLNSIGVGQLPGEAVTVSYSTLKLKKEINNDQNDQAGVSPWQSTSTSSIQDIVIATAQATDPTEEAKTYVPVIYKVEEKSVSTTYYKKITIDGAQKQVVGSEVTANITGSAAVLGALASEYLNNDIVFSNEDVSKTTTVIHSYDEKGNETRIESVTRGSSYYLIGSLGLKFVFEDGSRVTLSEKIILLSKEITTRYYAQDVVKEITCIYGPWHESIPGQQTIAASRDSFNTASDVMSYIQQLNIGELSLLDVRITINRKGQTAAFIDQAEVNNANNADGGDPNNGWRTESSADLELALGSATAQRRIELSLPHAPDDRFYGPSGGPYGSIASDAPQKAKQFGIVQNRLLLGNRSGMNIQTAPELLPAAPFMPFIVQANGLSGLYRTNGTSWTMSSEGLVVSTDALFMGAVGGTGDFWFPVAPGITTLPYTPPVVDGQMTVTDTVPVWNETLLVAGRTRTIATVVSLSYALELTTPLAITTKTAAAAPSVKSISAPAAAITVAAVAPIVSISATVRAPAAALAIEPKLPVVVSGGSVAVPTAVVAIAAVPPDLVGRQKTQVLIPAASVTLAAVSPAVASGGSVAPPAGVITVAGLAPAVTVSNPITGLSPLLWYDFSEAATVTLSGTTITQINDKGSRSWNLTKSSTGPTQGTWTNGLKCCDWGSDGHSNYLRNTTSTSTGIAEIYVVLDANFGSTFPTYNGLVSGTSDPGFTVAGQSGASGLYSYAGTSFDAAYVNNGASNSYSSGILTAINSPALLRIKMLDNSTIITTNGFQIGMDRSNGGRGWGGLVAEVVAFSSVLSSTDRTAVQNYLAGKWGLTLS